MKGLYLNVENAAGRAERVDRLIGATTCIAEASHPLFRDVAIDYHADAWDDGPITADPETGLFAAATGWLLFRGRLGALGEFARAFLDARARGEEDRVLSEIDAGGFVILIAAGDEPLIVTDPFGLHPHYFADSPFARIAPSPHFLKEDRAVVPAHAAILRAKNHLFGNLTIYEGVERLEPGAVTTPRGAKRYFRYESARDDVRRLPQTLHDALAAFRPRRTILPLSGGLDSRLIALSAECDRGYTFGPPETGDRPVARRFAHRFRDYKEFSLLDLSYPRAHREAGAAFFDGVCEKPFIEVISVYRHLHDAWGAGGVFLDGYLGDVLQRGTYLTYGGVRGGVAKLLPWMTLRGFDPIALLRRRHPTIPPEGFRIVTALFEEKIAPLPIDDLHKVVLFEILYGRGARITANGGAVLAGQYWIPAQAFFFTRVFRLLFGQDLADALLYKTVRAIWSGIPSEYSDVPTYSGFKPRWNPHRSRATMLVVKGLGKTGLYRRAVSYESELPRITWT